MHRTIALYISTEFPIKKIVMMVRYSKIKIVSLVMIHQSTLVIESAM